MNTHFTQLRWLATMLLLVAAMAMPSTAWAEGYDENGFGSESDPYEPATLTTDKYDIDGVEGFDEVYEIGNAGQLYWFADKVNNENAAYGSANAVLTKDITVNLGVLDASGNLANNTSGFRSWTPIGNYNVNYVSYAGTFDGQNHTISGLYFNNSSTNYVGLFGYSKGTIKNVGVVDSYFNGNKNVGGVCGTFFTSTITNCYNTGTISGTNSVGGVCGNSGGGTITNCYNTGAVSGEKFVGGVCGSNDDSVCTLTNCYNTGKVSGNNNVGGVCGYNYVSKITNCYNTGEVSGDNNVGGVCGNNDRGTIANCYYLSATATDDGGKTEGQFKNGEVCYLLNESKSAGAWGQTLSGTGKQDYPVLGGMPVYYRAEVYANTYGILTEGTQTITASSSPNVWYEFTPTETGTYQFSSADIKGSICVNTTKTDDDKQNITTSPTYSLTAETIYYVYVDYAPGEYKLTITKLSTTTALEAVAASPVYAVDGRIVCAGEFRIYDLLGRDVTRLNGSLCGVYIVKVGAAAVKVVVK